MSILDKYPGLREDFEKRYPGVPLNVIDIWPCVTPAFFNFEVKSKIFEYLREKAHYSFPELEYMQQQNLLFFKGKKICYFALPNIDGFNTLNTNLRSFNHRIPMHLIFNYASDDKTAELKVKMMTWRAKVISDDDFPVFKRFEKYILNAVDNNNPWEGEYNDIPDDTKAIDNTLITVLSRGRIIDSASMISLV